MAQKTIDPALAARLADLLSKPLSLPATNSERQHAFRERKRDAGEAYDTRSKAYNPGRSKFMSGQFVAIDGEGVSEGKSITYAERNGPKISEYTGQAHYMMLLAASTGQELVANNGRLSFAACMEFLATVSRETPGCILVCYGGSYDINQMMLYDLPRALLTGIGKGNYVQFRLDGTTYAIEYRARKMLRVHIWYNEVETYRYDKPDIAFTLWDTIGFFQEPFAVCMRKWLGNNHPDYLFIQTMKDRRAEFERHELATIRDYNAAECRALVAIMDKLRHSMQELGLVLTRWDGAGAVSGAMLSKHRIKQAKLIAPDDVFMAARRAFSGGHIEVMKLGTYTGTIHHYDVNSAYPAQIAGLPDLALGVWSSEAGTLPPPGFTLVHVQWSFKSGLPFYPLFFRCDDGSIIYPQHGAGWYWWPEFEVAQEFFDQFGGADFTIVEWKNFAPAAAAKPFGFIREYYAARLDMVRQDRAGTLTPDTEWMRGGEKVLKLGMNGGYGKLAQQLGSRGQEPPPYFQLEWAGYVTAGCRAQLMRAAMQDPGAIISFATDGLFSTRPLALDCPTDKVLGAWEYQTHTGMVVAMPGVYWLYDGGHTPGAADVPDKAYSRGFDKAYVTTPGLVMDAWRSGLTSVSLPIRRLVTMGSACAAGMGSDPAHRSAMWRARGRFLTGTRDMDISGSSRKRYPPSGKSASRLHLAMAQTRPRLNEQYAEWTAAGSDPGDARGLSGAYDIRWLMPRYGLDDIDPDQGQVIAQEAIDADDDMF